MSINLVGFMGSDPEYLDKFIQERLDRASAEKDGDPSRFAAKFSRYLSDIEDSDPDNIIDGPDTEKPGGGNDSAGTIGGGGSDFDALRGGGSDNAGGISIDGDGSNRSGSVLTKEEENLVRGTALLEFNMAMMSNRSLHKKTKTRNKETKQERKRVEAEDLAHYAKMAAKARAERKSANRKKG